MIKKPTFKYFRWLLIAIILLFSINGVLVLLQSSEFFTTYLFRIIFLIVSFAAIVSLISVQLDDVKNKDITSLQTSIPQ